MSLETYHDLEPPPGRRQKDGEKNSQGGEWEKISPEKTPSNENERGIKTMFAQWRENADKYAVNHSDAKGAIENDIQKAYTEEKMLDNWPA